MNATAQSFHTTRQFDLIVMTGHAFQVLVDDTDLAATLKVMRDHLAPGGTIAFETRNPDINWSLRWLNLTRDHLLDGQKVRQSFEVLAATPDRITFATHYAFPDIDLTSTSTLRFLRHDTLTQMLEANGLTVRTVFGDWNSSPFDAASSNEMIFLAGH